jgi:hypothetical protein
MSEGTVRGRLTRTLTEAYARGLLSEETFAGRMQQVLADTVLEPERLVGDVGVRAARWRLACGLSESVRTVVGRIDDLLTGEPSTLLALDWAAGESELVLGRSSGCDVRVDESTVSRRHARLWSHHGRWLLQDLGSTNGTFVNGRRAGRCELRPGDLLLLGEARLRVD